MFNSVANCEFYLVIFSFIHTHTKTFIFRVITGNSASKHMIKQATTA